MKTHRSLWVVEMWREDAERWEATLGVALEKEAAKLEQEVFHQQNPDDAFRLRRYERLKGPA